MARLESTIERIGSIAVVVSIPLFVLSIALLMLGVVNIYEHGFMAIIGGFTVFCLGVTLPLYASLVGGHPRRGFELLSPVISVSAALISLLVTLWGGTSWALLFLSASMASATLYSFSQVERSKPRIRQRYALIYPYFMGFMAALFGYIRENVWDFFVLYTIGYASPLVSVVGLFYLSRSYNNRRPLIGYMGLSLNALAASIYMLLEAASIKGELLYASPFILASLSFLLVSLSLGFWSGFKSPISQVRYMAEGHSAQLVGVILSLIFALNIHSSSQQSSWIIFYIHSLLIGHALVGIYTQAIMLSPIIIASTWRRRSLDVAPHIIALGAVALRPLYPEISGTLLIASLAYMLAIMRPSVKRMMYIIAFGTEKGYLLAYRNAVKNADREAA